MACCRKGLLCIKYIKILESKFKGYLKKIEITWIVMISLNNPQDKIIIWAIFFRPIHVKTRTIIWLRQAQLLFESSKWYMILEHLTFHPHPIKLGTLINTMNWLIHLANFSKKIQNSLRIWANFKSSRAIPEISQFYRKSYEK